VTNRYTGMGILSFLLIFFVYGCGQTGEQPVATLNETGDTLPRYNAEKSTPPYDDLQFRSVLRHSKLQYPGSQAIVNYGKFNGYKAPWFYSEKGILYFSIDKTKDISTMRSELRDRTVWKTSSATPRIWSATLKCFKPQKGVNSYTWMQIHGTSDTYNYPLLRLMWVRDYHGISNHLWAIRIVSDAYSGSRKYDWIDLGKNPDGYFDANVRVANNRLTLSVNGTKILRYDVEYWQGVANFFKAGVYINRHDDFGKATVAFKSLMFD